MLLKSGMDEITLKRIEQGESVQASTVSKVCFAINIPTIILFDPI